MPQSKGTSPTPPPALPALAPDEAGVVSWVHLGDLHVVRRHDESHGRLEAIVAELAALVGRSACFAFLPGDIANEGQPDQYQLVRDALSRLELPWFAVVGDHDVHEGTLDHVQRAMAPALRHAFDVGPLRAVALNAFDDGDDPRAFALGAEQLAWLDAELRTAAARGQSSVVFVHCYPTDLAHGGARLTRLLRDRRARIVEMGHTHYNELANDGTTLFIATRSTGQIEEGPVGFSITSVDGESVSWRFFELGARPAVMITSPCDARLERDDAPGLARAPSRIRVRAKAWSDESIVEVEALAAGRAAALARVGASAVWEGEIDLDLEASPSEHAELSVRVRDAAGRVATDTIQLALEGRARPRRHEVDQENAIGAWPEHGIVGTQLGPNKNGHDW